MKVKIITVLFDELQLEKEINKWLAANEDKQVIDIKLSGNKIAMVIYKEN